MLFSELPESDILVASCRLGDLTDAISISIGPATRLNWCTLLTDGPISCWIYFAERADDESDDNVKSPSEAARALLMFRDHKDAKFPWQQLGDDKVRGWEIRKVEIEGRTAIVATAALVDELITTI